MSRESIFCSKGNVSLFSSSKYSFSVIRLSDLDSLKSVMTQLARLKESIKSFHDEYESFKVLRKTKTKTKEI